MDSEDLLNCSFQLRNKLLELRNIVEGEGDYDVPRGVLGLKVWVLPPWYHRAVSGDGEVIATVADFGGSLVHRPALRLVGYLEGGEGQQRSGVKWTVGLGLLGEAMFRPTGEWETFVHTAWPPETEKLPRRRFRQLGRGITKGHSQKDIRRLNSLYGSAVAVRLVHGDGVAFGCLTAHTPRGTEPSSKALQTCGINLWIAADNIIETIDSELHCFL